MNKNKNFFSALKYALNGIKYAVLSEKNVKIELVIGVIAIICGFIFQISIFEWGILCLCIGLVLCSEFINTAIENTIDLITEEYNEKAKIAKDVSAGCVLIASIISVIIGLLLFLPKILAII